MIRTTAYAYPWDVARLGADAVLDDLSALGMAGIDLAATYHPIDALSPRDPGGAARLFTSPRGAVHFPARPERYGRIVPSLHPDASVRAAWPAVAEAAAARELAVNAWTVVLFQPWICDAHPDCARVLPSGDPVGPILCPASPHVQEYVANLCADLADQIPIHTLRLEMASSPVFDYGWLRPRILVEVPPLARQLLTLCFCASCTRRGADAGIDVERVRRDVNRAVAEELGGMAPPEPQLAAGRAAGLAADDELHAFAVQHEAATVELVRAAVSRIGGERPRVSTMVNAPFSLLVGDVERDLVADLVGAVDQVLVFPSADLARAERVAQVAARVEPPVGLAVFVVPVSLGGLAGWPAPAAGEGDRVRAELRLASRFALEEVNIYNYGLLRDRDVRELVTAIGEVLG